jgi:hypothetical protein
LLQCAEDLQRIIDLILACCIIHNLILDDVIPKRWTEPESQDSDNESNGSIEDDDYDTVTWNEDPEERRRRMFGFVMEQAPF